MKTRELDAQTDREIRKRERERASFSLSSILVRL